MSKRPRYRKKEEMVKPVSYLFLVHTRATSQDGETLISKTLLVNGTDEDDVVMKARWFEDQSKYKTWSIKKIENVPPGIRVLSEQLKDANPREQEETPVHTGTQQEQQRTNQPKNFQAWAVGVAGSLNASSVEHAFRKLGKYLSLRGAGVDASNPLHIGSFIRIEPLGEIDSTAMSNALNRIQDEGKRPNIVSGGAVSPR